MGRAALRVVVILAFLGGLLEGSEGLLCLRWAKGKPNAVAGFFCPERALYCCGTCYKPYCCSSKEDRLDQDQCHYDSQEEVVFHASKADLKNYAALFGVTAGLVTSAIVYTACRELFRQLKSLRSAPQQYRILDHRPSRPSSCGSLTFFSTACSRVWCRDCSPPAGSRVAVGPAALEDHSPAGGSPCPYADIPVQFHRMVSGAPGDGVVLIPPPSTYLSTAVSSGTQDQNISMA